MSTQYVKNSYNFGWFILPRPKIKNCVFQVTRPCLIFCPPTLKFLSIFRGFPRDFLGQPSCFPIFDM